MIEVDSILSAQARGLTFAAAPPDGLISVYLRGVLVARMNGLKWLRVFEKSGRYTLQLRARDRADGSEKHIHVKDCAWVMRLHAACLSAAATAVDQHRHAEAPRFSEYGSYGENNPPVAVSAPDTGDK